MYIIFFQDPVNTSLIHPKTRCLNYKTPGDTTSKATQLSRTTKHLN